MRKITAKILTLMVTLAFVMSFVSIPAFAYKTQNYPDWLWYVDSETNSSVAESDRPYYRADNYTAREEAGGIGRALSLADFKTRYGAVDKDSKVTLTFEGTTSWFGTPSASDTTEWINKVNTYFENSNIRLTIDKTASGEENNRRTPWVVITESSIPGESSSGVNAMSLACAGEGAGDVQTFTFEKIAAKNITSGEYDVETDKKVTAVGFIIISRNESTNAYSVTANFAANGNKVGSKTLSVPALTESTPDTKGRAFFGFDAPKGAYISDIVINMPLGQWPRLDDFAIITEEVAAEDSMTATVEVTGETTISRPVYGVTKSVDYTAIAKDADGEELVFDNVLWSLAESVAGASIDASTGKLSITHEFDTSKQIKVVATSSLNSSVKGEITVSVTETAPYYEPTRITANATTYEKDVFVKDLEKAKNIAVLNFEEGSYNVTGSSKVNKADAELISVPVSGTSAVMPISCESYNLDYSTNYGKGFLIRDNSENNVLTRFWIPRNGWHSKLTFDTSALGNLKPVAIGWLGSSSGGTASLDMHAEIKCSGIDGTYFTPSKDYYTDGGVEFFGFRAPAGSYIESMDFYTGAWALIDDICIILEDPATSKPRFSKDEAGEKPIFEIADAAGAEKIYVNLPADSGATQKLILAAYDNSGMLLDVDLTDLSTRKAEIAIPTGKTVDTIKMFVWDSITKLIPVEGYAIIIE